MGQGRRTTLQPGRIQALAEEARDAGREATGDLLSPGSPALWPSLRLQQEFCNQPRNFSACCVTWRLVQRSPWGLCLWACVATALTLLGSKCGSTLERVHTPSRVVSHSSAGCLHGRQQPLHGELVAKSTWLFSLADKGRTRSRGRELEMS